MSPLNPETWHMHPAALYCMTRSVAILAVVIGAVSWWTDWRWPRK